MKVIEKGNTLKIIKGTRIWRFVVVLCFLVFGPLSLIFFSISYGWVLGLGIFLLVFIVFAMIFYILKPFIISCYRDMDKIEFSKNAILKTKKPNITASISDVKNIHIKEVFKENRPINSVSIDHLSLKLRRSIFIVLLILVLLVTFFLLIQYFNNDEMWRDSESTKLALFGFAFFGFLIYKLIRSIINPNYANENFFNNSEDELGNAVNKQISIFYNVFIVFKDDTKLNVSEMPGVGTSIHIKKDMFTIAEALARFINVPLAVDYLE